jgi:short-subunit dehydrogenase
VEGLPARAVAAWASGAVSYWATLVCAIVGAAGLVTFLLPAALACVTHRRQDLKKRYDAQWAVVTGASSGIGLSITRQLAAQGINVVMVAIANDMLPASAAAVRADFAGVQVRTVGVDLGAADSSVYLKPLADATGDIPVSIVCNNAGFMITGLFEDIPLDKQLGNVHCNAVAAVAITHLFVTRMRAAKMRGAVTFTSSPVSFLPSPGCAMYGCTKAFLTHFATSLAAELNEEGIHVAALHPSPVLTGFYAGDPHGMASVKFFRSTAVGPDRVAAALLAGIGRSVIIDQGYFPFVERLMLRVSAHVPPRLRLHLMPGGGGAPRPYPCPRCRCRCRCRCHCCWRDVLWRSSAFCACFVAAREHTRMPLQMPHTTTGAPRPCYGCSWWSRRSWRSSSHASPSSWATTRC